MVIFIGAVVFAIGAFIGAGLVVAGYNYGQGDKK